MLAMPDWLISIPAFLVAIGVLVAVHEYGHFWVARRMGVKVLRYSIGFGHRIWSWHSPKTGTEYRLSAIPLGGYVKMLDEREGGVPKSEQHLAFNRKSVWQRIAIVAAGPGINFAFAIVAYWVVFMLGVSGIKPVIGDVEPDTRAAAAGLARGDSVTAVGGSATENWQMLRLALIDSALNGDQTKLTVVGENGRQRAATLDFSGISAEPKDLFDDLGMQPYRPEGDPILAEVLAGSAAADAGLVSGDRVLAADGEPLRGPQALVNWVQARPGATVDLRIERDNTPRDVTVTLASTEIDGESAGRLGARITVDASEWDALRTQRRLGPLAALPAAAAETWSITALTGRLLWRMVIGDVSWRNISGPVQIADYAGKTASVGLEPFLSFLALISVSLAVLNLLPVPVLDGGHLLYYAIELVRGRPLSEEVQAMGQQVGLMALLLLMSLAFYNDFARLFG